MVNQKTQKEAPLPKPRDFKFVSAIDRKAQSRAAVHLLAEYATNASRFFHDRDSRYAVECLVSARKFAEYMVTYVAEKHNIDLIEVDENNNRISFFGRVDNLKKTVRTVNDFPANELKRIWRDAGDAAHPPKGTSEKDINDYKNAYRLRAPEVLKDAFKIGEWLEKEYGKLSWFARLKFFLRKKRSK